MADNVTPRNAAMAYGYGVEAHPTAPGDLHGIRKPVEVELPGLPPGAAPDNFQGVNADAQINAQRTGLARPIGESPKTADALLRSIHSGLMGMPGQERARFLDVIPRYYQTINEALKGLAQPMAPMSGGQGQEEYPAAGPQDADAIAQQMGLNPDEVRQVLAQQQQSPTAPQTMDYSGQGGPQGGGAAPQGRPAPMPRPKPAMPPLDAAARAQGY